MEKNVGGFDRVWRLVGGGILVVVGLAALAGVVSLGVIPAVVLTVLGAVFVATGVVQKCVINRLIGVDTSHHETTEAEPMEDVPSKRPN